jgi:hypothetical protein
LFQEYLDKVAPWRGLLSIVALFFCPAAFGQSFTIAASPSALTIYPGQQNVPITVTVSNSDYSGPIVVTLSGLPSGITASPLTLTAGSSGTLNLSASVASGQEGFPATAASMTTSWTAGVSVIGAAGSLQAASQLALTVSISNPSFAPAPSAINLPIVTINTNGAPVVSKTIDVPGTITITSADGSTSYLPNSSDSDNTGTFHVHGNSTAAMPKLPYHISLNTSLDLLNTMGLSCPYVTSGKAKPACDKSKSYILLANYDDKTFLRDWSASALANAIPIGNGYLNSPADSPSPSGTSSLMPWAPHSLFVELYLNGVYEGNYQLIEEVKVDSHRVNITEMGDTDTVLPQLSGGYLLEIDAEKGEDFNFVTTQGVDIGLVDPDFSPEVPEQTDYIANYVDTAEAALFSGNFTDPVQGWRAYFDEASAVNFYIVNDLMGNVDGGDFYSSDYLYKDLNNPLLYMGPVWDFDVSSGNVNYSGIANPSAPWMQTYALWYAQWFKDPGFQADVATQWNMLKANGVFTTWLASIQQQANSLQQSQANNSGRWPMQGIEVWPNSEAVGSYNGEVDYLIGWLTLRMAYLDSVFNNRTSTTTALSMSAATIRYGSSITLSAQVSGGTNASGSVSFLANGVLLGTASLAGSTATYTTQSLPLGPSNVNAVYSGDTHNGLSSSATQPVTVQPALIPTVTSLASPSGTPNQATQTAFSVSVLSNSGSVAPTGILTLNSNGSALGSASLSSSGTATVNAILPVGTESLQVTYSGDANYQGSTSNVLALVVAAVPEFALAAATPNANANGARPATVMLTVTPQYGFNQSVSFACSDPSNQVQCTFSPATVTPSSGPVTTTASLVYSKNNTAKQSHGVSFGTRVGGGIALALLLWFPTRKRRIRSYFTLTALIVTSLALSSCSSSNPPAIVSVTISATGGSITQTTSISLTVK